jgi:integrase
MRVRMLDRSGYRDYRYLIEDVDRHGNIRIYFRLKKGQPKIRLKALPGTEEFDTEYRRALTAKLRPPAEAASAGDNVGPAKPGTLRWLCQQYLASSSFNGQADSTRRQRRAVLDWVCHQKIREGSSEKAGNLPFARMEPKHVATLRDKKKGPEAANSVTRALRALFTWAVSPDYGHATNNPAAQVSFLDSKNPNGIAPWTEGDVALYEARHPLGTKARLALDLLLYTGVRRSDVVRLGPQMERWFAETLPDGSVVQIQKLVFAETKGRERIVKRHELPILPPLRRSIDATAIGHLVYLTSRSGHPHTVQGFADWFARQCRMAGLTGRSAHGLRKLGAQRCVQAGATVHQLMALFGWTTLDQAELYTREANRAKLEGGAATLLQGPTGNKSVPLSPALASSGTLRGKKVL